MRENLEVALDTLSDKNARRSSHNRGASMNPLPVHIYREHDYSDFTSTKNLSLRAETLRLKATPAILALVNTHLEAEHALQSPDLSDDLADPEAAALAADVAMLEEWTTRHQEVRTWAVPESEVYAMRDRVRMGWDGLIRRRRDRAITDDKDAIKRARYDGIALDV